MIAELPLVQDLFGYKEIASISWGAIGAIGGLASAGINAYMSYRDRRRAERALAALGPRKSLTVPKEILSAYQERLKRSKSAQGFSQAELNQMRSAQARQNATMFNRAAGIGSSPMALQAIAANTDARNWANVAAQNAAMVRERRSSNLSAADALAGQVSQYGYNIQQADDAYRLAVEKALGAAKAQQDVNIGGLYSGLTQLGSTIASSPEMWDRRINLGIGSNRGPSNVTPGNLGYGSENNIT